MDFKERSRLKLDDDTVETPDGEEIATKKIEIKSEKWKAKVKVPKGALRLEVEDKGKKVLAVRGKVKETGEKAKMTVNLENYAYLDDEGEIAFKKLDDLDEKLKSVFKAITGN